MLNYFCDNQDLQFTLKNLELAEITALLEKEIAGAKKGEYRLPGPLHPDHWEKAYSLPLKEVERIGPWRLVHVRNVSSVQYMLHTSSMKAKLKFCFPFPISRVPCASWRWRPPGMPSVLPSRM